MTAPARLAAVKRQMLAIENALNDMSRRSRNKERAHKLASVADAVTDLRAVDLWEPVLSARAARLEAAVGNEARPDDIAATGRPRAGQIEFANSAPFRCGATKDFSR